jgi:predicted metal-dependent hydrolase
MTMTGFHTIDFGGEAIEFSLERTTRRKTVSISVGYEGVRVLSPPDMDDESVLGLVRKRGAWVLRKQAGYRELGGALVIREFVSGETFYYLGRQYRLKVVPEASSVVTRVTARGALLFAPVPVDVDEAIQRASVRSGLRHWYREKARLRFSTRANAIASLLGVPAPAIHIVDQSKRWGSCDARGHIRLNWRLIMAPISLVDYVIAHEACHVLEHNHSRRFWRLLETIMPDYETRVRQLDRLGYLFTW